MKRSLVVLLHTGFWVCYLILIIIILGVLVETGTDESRLENIVETLFLFAIVPSAIAFYSFYLWLFPKYLQNKKIFLAVVFGILISLACAFLGFVALTFLYADACMGKDDDSFLGGMIVMTIISLISGVVGLVIKGFITWFEEIRIKESLRQKNHEMEMALVKSQLDPHFLFNTINNIDVLIIKDAVEASDYLNKLSDIMRFMLYETRTDTILLSREIEYIDKYIELQKIRTSNLNYASFVVTGSTDNKTIAPMVFIPFIENAFKHTNNKKLENAITINIFIKERTIEFVCENKFTSIIKKQRGDNGLGNDLIQKRLQLIYPGKHTLQVINQNGLYRVHLIINNG